MPFTLFNQTRLKFITLMTYFDKISRYIQMLFFISLFLQSLDEFKLRVFALI